MHSTLVSKTDPKVVSTIPQTALASENDQVKEESLSFWTQTLALMYV